MHAQTQHSRIKLAGQATHSDSLAEFVVMPHLEVVQVLRALRAEAGHIVLSICRLDNLPGPVGALLSGPCPASDLLHRHKASAQASTLLSTPAAESSESSYAL